MFQLIENQGSTNHEWISNALTIEVPREFDESDRRKGRVKTLRIDNRDYDVQMRLDIYRAKV
jgi:hypothetical protein